MNKEEKLKLIGTITKVEANGFRVELEDTGTEIFAYKSGHLRKYKISILVPDKVEVEIGGYDLERGRITRRL